MRIMGRVKWFNDAKGYGFIQPDDHGSDVFVHFTEIKMDGFRSLYEDQRVSFTEETRVGASGPYRWAKEVKPWEEKDSEIIHGSSIICPHCGGTGVKQ